jgi:hypothetical protein
MGRLSPSGPDSPVRPKCPRFLPPPTADVLPFPFPPRLTKHHADDRGGEHREPFSMASVCWGVLHEL